MLSAIQRLMSISLLCVVITSCDGTTTTAVPGDNKIIQWTIDPVPPLIKTVGVLNPSEAALFSALGTYVIPAGTDLGKRVTNTGNTNTTKGRIEFTLNDVTVEDAGDYRHKYDPGNGGLRVNNVGVTLVVYAKPSTPSITELLPPVEGRNMTLRCVIQSNSKPDNHESLQMTYIWYRNGADLPSEDRYVISGSQLQVKNIQRTTDNGTVFTCKAYENVTLTSDVSAGYTVVVHYGPKVTNISPSDRSYRHVEETSDTLGPINCIADCYPGCSFKWFRDGQMVRTSAVLTLTGITRSDRGTYFCRAYNEHGGKNSTSFDLSVEYGPRVTDISPSDRSYTRVEETSDTLGPINCTADCYPGCRFQWFRDSQVVRTSAVLTLTGITRSDRGTYLCRAYNDHGGMNSTSFDLSVEYGPDLITLSPSAVSYTKIEDDSLNEITCTSSCNPPCGYSWERDGNQTSNGQTLRRINNIKRGQAGQYVCKVTNKHDNREASVTVIVWYAPDKPELSINGNTADVRENSSISFQCTTQSVPPSTMKIYRENLTTLTTAADTVSTTHTIPHANCLDTGHFYCSAENVIRKSTSERRNVNVLCKPRQDHRVSHVSTQALGSGESMNISGTLISNPPPTIYWSMPINGSAMSSNLTNNTDNFVFHNIQKSLTVSSRAVRTGMKKSDFGEYMMHAYNDYGQSEMSFTVTPSRKPDEPTLLGVVCESEKPVQISFAPNFDGGDTQVFTLGMRSATVAEFKEVGEEFTDNKQDKITLSGPVIDAGTVYVFRVTARNEHGTTKSMSHRNCSIEIIPVDPPGSPVAMIGGIAGAGVVAVIIIVLVVVLLKRRQVNNKKNDSTELVNGRSGSDQDDPEDGMKPNILYESAGPRYNPPSQNDKNGNQPKRAAGNVNDVYAEVVKPKTKKLKVNNDVYAEVVKPKGKDKKGDKKGKKAKPAPGSQYGNIELNNSSVKIDGDVYENAPRRDIAQERPSRRKNDDGLIYIDVEIKGSDSKHRKGVIHGLENKNEYAEVDFSKHADPLPSDDEEDNAEKKKEGE